MHISSMADDYYRFSDSDHVLHGESTGKTYRLGDSVVVQVVRVDSVRRQIDLGLVEILDSVRESERELRGRRGRVPRHNSKPAERRRRPRRARTRR